VCPGKTGGNGSRGEVRITEYSDDITIFIRDASTGALINVSTNVTMIGTSATYFSTTTSGNTTITAFPDVYLLRAVATGYSQNQVFATVAGTSNLTIYLSRSTQSATFAVRDTLDEPVPNTIVTFNLNINGSIVTYAQIETDFSGIFSLNLDPTATYIVSAVNNNYDVFTGNIQPSQSITYVIRMQFSSLDPYTTVLNGTFYSYDAVFINSTSMINITWEVTSLVGDIEYWCANTTYQSVTYSDNDTGVPG
jgi:hypothetical protein